MSRFVVDASVTMSWCYENEDDPYATSALRALQTSQAVVPWVWSLEVANALLVGERRSRLTEAETFRFLDVLERLAIVMDESPPNHLMDDVLSIGRQYALSSYDACYLELALRKGVPLATLDERLRATAIQVGLSIATF